MKLFFVTQIVFAVALGVVVFHYVDAAIVYFCGVIATLL